MPYKYQRMLFIHEIIARPRQTTADAPASEPFIDGTEGIGYMVPQ